MPFLSRDIKCSPTPICEQYYCYIVCVFIICVCVCFCMRCLCLSTLLICMSLTCALPHGTQCCSQPNPTRHDSALTGIRARTHVDSTCRITFLLWMGSALATYLPNSDSLSIQGFPGEESTCNAGDLYLIPGLRRSHEEENGNPLQYSCLENFIDRGAWQATVHGVAKSWIRLSD